ncbi:hypothetical protein ABHF91_09735 [Pseudaeromonas sp. ZJS20]|uniref:hypothetical protein n=1 Tax=Pseudaeromonas aegiceratis TaxID=3153928 RepID=UPI00390CBE6D
MYLSKNSSGTYYTRIPLPKALRDRGMPFAIRTSLATKQRPIAIDRNLRLAAVVRDCIACAPAELTHAGFLAWIRQQIDTYKANGFAVPELVTAAVTPPIPADSHKSPTARPSTASLTLGQLQAEFIARKASDGITLRSVKQLKTRTEALVTALGADCRVSSIKYKQADGFVRALTAHGLKDKTVQEYKAACAQMFGHAVKMEYLSRDPFEQITIKNRKPTPRTRWQSHELKRLFTSEKFRQPSTGSQQEDYWIPLLLLHSGARPSEICQLRCQDVVSVQGVMCLRISNEGEGC